MARQKQKNKVSKSKKEFTKDKVIKWKKSGYEIKLDDEIFDMLIFLRLSYPLRCS